ncbi:uncharacterized protein LOC123530024 [Mercenaria mercenaria]|uniref:uncharacterized protein LOC123530024 n=1 Tax=Mercenaria mercenaria TaxID=6596 RepID=UPI00234FAA65|nr:uncharacterized protein LOC123530024 [Mercenaria mercenaria]
MTEAALIMRKEGLVDNPTTEDDRSSSKSTKNSSSKGRTIKQDVADFSLRLSQQEEKFASMESKMDNVLAILSTRNFNSDQNDSFGDRRSSTGVNSRQTSGLGHLRIETETHPSPQQGEDDELSYSPTRENYRENCDTLSICVGKDESRSFLDTSVCSETTNVNDDSDRFLKYLSVKKDNMTSSLGVNQESQSIMKDNESLNVNNLGDKFGADAVTSHTNKSSVGLVLEKNQIDTLNESWRSAHPSNLSSYRDVYRKSFRIAADFENYLKVPQIDMTVEELLQTRHNDENFAFGKHPSLYSKQMKGFEKYAYSGQLASRMGIITVCYIQQALGTLLDTLQQKDVNIDAAIQTVRDTFAISAKSLDQIARAGAFHHLIRRNATLIDTGLYGYKGYSHAVMSLPLRADGVFGTDFDKKIEEKSKLRKNLNDFLPEGLKRSASGGHKRRATTNITMTSDPKKPRTGFVDYRGRNNTQSFLPYNSSGGFNKPKSGFRSATKSKAQSRRSDDAPTFKR